MAAVIEMAARRKASVFSVGNLQRRIDSKRQGLRPALDVGGEGDDGAKFAKASGEGCDRSGEDAGPGQGEGHRPETVPRPCPQDRCGFEQAAIGRFEGKTDGAHHQGEGHDGGGEGGALCCEGQLDSERVAQP